MKILSIFIMFDMNYQLDLEKKYRHNLKICCIKIIVMVPINQYECKRQHYKILYKTILNVTLRI